MADIALEAQGRALTGKGAAHKLRAEGFVPANLYGVNVESRNLAVPARSLGRLLKSGHSNSLINLSVEGEKSPRPVIIKEVQSDPVSNEIWHVDFLQVALDQAVSTTVPVLLVGEEKRESDGGIVNHLLREIEISCLPTNIPEHVEVDVSGLKLHQTLTVSDVTFPAGVEPLTDADEAVVSISAPTVAPAEETEEAEAESTPEA